MLLIPIQLTIYLGFTITRTVRGFRLFAIPPYPQGPDRSLQESLLCSDSQ